MSELRLAWRLARAGGRFRTSAIIAGNAIGTALFLLTLSIPAAIRPPGEVADREDRILAVGLVVFLCLPVTMLLLSIGRLSASTRDRRLASLRMLGLGPGRTRLVAALENGLLATAGAGVGLAAYLAAAPLVDTLVAAGPGWFQRPLRLSGAAAAVTCAGLVLLSMVVSLAPTRSLRHGSLRLRREGATARPSWWRVVPLGLGLATLACSLLLPAPAKHSDLSEDRYAGIVLTGVALTGLGLALALPLAVRAVATLIAGRSGGVTVRLAAARLVCEPAGTVRVVSGVAVAAFLVTGSVGVLAAFQHTPEYVETRHAYEEGPQRHRLRPAPEGPALTNAHLRRVAAVPEVRAVIPVYRLDARGCRSPDPGDDCGRVFVGTCEQLNLLWVVPGCGDAPASLIGTPGVPGRIELANPGGDTATVVPDARVLTIDDEATRARFPEYDPVSLFVPVDLPRIAALLGEPQSYYVLTGPGQPPRDALQAAAADLPVLLAPQWVQPYREVQRLQLLSWTMSAIVIGIGLLSTLLTTVDRAIERRRQIAAQVAVGVPLRVLRGSQLLQTLVPLWMAIVAAIAFGFLPLVASLRVVTTAGAAPLATVASMTVGGLTAAAVVAGATLPGIGGRLTPDLLRRE